MLSTFTTCELSFPYTQTLESSGWHPQAYRQPELTTSPGVKRAHRCQAVTYADSRQNTWCPEAVEQLFTWLDITQICFATHVTVCSTERLVMYLRIWLLRIVTAVEYTDCTVWEKWQKNNYILWSVKKVNYSTTTKRQQPLVTWQWTACAWFSHMILWK